MQGMTKIETLYGKPVVIFENAGGRLRLFTIEEKRNHVIDIPDLKKWDNHVQRLQRSNLPIVAVNTIFTPKGIEIDGIATTEMLYHAKDQRGLFQ